MPAEAPGDALAVSAALRSVAARAGRVTGLLGEALALRASFPALAAVAADPEAAALRLTFLSLPAEMKFTAQLLIGAPPAPSAVVCVRTRRDIPSSCGLRKLKLMQEQNVERAGLSIRRVYPLAWSSGRCLHGCVASRQDLGFSLLSSAARLAGRLHILMMHASDARASMKGNYRPLLAGRLTQGTGSQRVG